MEKHERKTLFLLPVRRRLMCVTVSYLAGVYLSAVFALPMAAMFAFCAVIAIACCFRMRGRKSTLFLFCVISLMVGNGAASMQLAVRDEATPPNTPISGTVVLIESDYRVMLEDVSLPLQETTNRPIVVTLMREENAEVLPPLPKIGQRIEGVGRLFEPDEVRNPGGMDSRIRALCEGYELSGYILPGWTAQGEERFSLMECFRQARLFLAKKAERLFGEAAPLFLAVMLGVRDALDTEVTAAMRLTGTAHILTVSGMHLTILSGAIGVLFRALRLSRRVSCAMEAALLVVFTLLTGCAVGTVRALIMALLRLLAPERGRQYEPLTALSAAALAITAYRPLLAFDGAFQFSFFVVLGILLLSQRLRLSGIGRLMNRRMRGLSSLLFVSVSAQIAAVPMQLSLYGYVPLLSLPMNLLCGFVMNFLLVGGWGALMAGLLFEGAGAWCALWLSQIGGWFEELSVLAAGWDYAILRLPSPHRLLLVAFALLMALLSPRIRFGRGKAPAAVLTAAVLIAGYLPKLNPAPRYVQLDVGQGDASLIRSGRHAVIVDVGPADSYDLLRYLRCEGLYIDAVILSHLDEDHAGALNVLLDSEIDIPRVIMAENAREEAASLEVIEGVGRLEAEGVAAEYAAEGDEIQAGDVRLSVLSPDESLSGSNERSLLLHANVVGTDILLTGDLPIDCEPETVPDCDVLKVAHHGSKYASGSEFLRQASPETALISVGANNSYGHPHARVLEELAAVGAKVYRTDENGCITVWLDADKQTVNTMFPAQPGIN